jgi:hypothetical protein
MLVLSMNRQLRNRNDSTTDVEKKKDFVVSRVFYKSRQVPDVPDMPDIPSIGSVLDFLQRPVITPKNKNLGDESC